MNNPITYDSQFTFERSVYLQQGFDFLDWYRYFFIIKKVVMSQWQSVLDVGDGSGIVKSCLKPLVENYQVMDVNAKLEPDILMDVREFIAELDGGFECVIAAELLEHIPFADLEKVCSNLFAYLKEDGEAIITIPHQRYSFLFMTPFNKPYVFTIPRRKVRIDPSHCWEIGDGKVKQSHVEYIFEKAGFKIEEYKKLLYVDYWVLHKG